MGARTRIGSNVTLVAIIYGAKSGHVRQHVYAEHDHFEYEIVHSYMLPGEAMCFVDITHHHAGHDVFHQAIRDAVKAHGGVDAVLFAHEPGARLFAHVDPQTGIVGSIIMADPDIDKNLDEWVEHPYGTVAVGHIYDRANGTFTNPTPHVRHPDKVALYGPE